MTRRRLRKHHWAHRPELLTEIRSPWEKFKKVDWNFTRYEDAILSRPCNPEEVMFRAIDFCIAMDSLNDWVAKALKQAARNPVNPIKDVSFSDFESLLREKVVWLPAIQAIANTAKHGEYRDTGWPDGIFKVAPFYPENLEQTFDSCEDGVEMFHLIHKHRDVVWWDAALSQANSHVAVPAYIAFGDSLDAWEDVLETVGLKEN